MQFIWPVNTDKVRFNTYIYVNEIINGHITIDEIEKAIKRLKNNKASSDDDIINEYIKQ